MIDGGIQRLTPDYLVLKPQRYLDALLAKSAFSPNRLMDSRAVERLPHVVAAIFLLITEWESLAGI